MVTTETWGRRALFRAEPWAGLIIDTLYHYRGSAYLLHEFVVMPEHIHLLITPVVSLEKAVQFIKGGFSYRAKKELGSNLEVWQTGFSDHRIRNTNDYAQHVRYIRENPVRKGIVLRAEDYPYSSALGGFELDDVPLGLKPQIFRDVGGAPKGAPLQNNNEAKGEPLQSNSKAEGAPLRNKIKSNAA